MMIIKLTYGFFRGGAAFLCTLSLLALSCSPDEFIDIETVPQSSTLFPTEFVNAITTTASDPLSFNHYTNSYYLTIDRTNDSIRSTTSDDLKLDYPGTRVYPYVLVSGGASFRSTSGSPVFIQDDKRPGVSLIYTQIRINAPGTNDTVLETTYLTTDLSDDKARRIYITSDPVTGGIELYPFEIKKEQRYTAENKYRLRVLNLNSILETEVNRTVNVTDLGALANDNIIDGFLNVPYEGLTEYREFPAGPYRFRVSDVFSKPVFFWTAVEDVSFTDSPRSFYTPNYKFLAGGSYTLVVKENTYEIIPETDFTQSTPPTFSNIKFMNANPAYAGIVTFILEGQAGQEAAYGEASGTISTTLGTKELSVIHEGITVYRGQVEILANQELTLFLLPSQTNANESDILSLNYQPPVIESNSVASSLFSTSSIRLRSGAYVRFLNLCPDAGQVTFLSTEVTETGPKETIIGPLAANLSFKEGQEINQYISLGDTEYTEITQSGSTTIVTSKYAKLPGVSVRKSTENPTIPGEPLNISLLSPITSAPSPAIYTIALIGKLITDDPASQAKIIVLKDLY